MGMKDFMITIGRQYGSGGKEVGRILAQKLGIPLYGKEELMEMEKGRGCNGILHSEPRSGSHLRRR